MQGSHFKQDMCKGEASMSTGMRSGAASRFPSGRRIKGARAEAFPVGSVDCREAGQSGRDRELEGEGWTSGP